MWLHVKAMSDWIESIYRENYHTKTMHNNKAIKMEKYLHELTEYVYTATS